MKKVWLVFAGILAVLSIISFTGCSSGSDNNDVVVNSQQQGIWVSAVGKVNIKPDLAILSLGVESQEISVADAQAKASEAMDKVIKALKDQGIEDKDIQTQYFNISQMTRGDIYGEKSTISGYRVTNTVKVNVHDVEKAGKIIDAVAEAGGDLTRINNIEFTVQEPSAYYKQARTLAMQYAKEKAQQIADEGGIKLGDITYITENSNTYYQPYGNYMMNDAMQVPVPATVAAPISVGQLEISTTIQLAYAVRK
jgi:uncharacterized protein